MVAGGKRRDGDVEFSASVPANDPGDGVLGSVRCRAVDPRTIGFIGSLIAGVSVLVSDLIALDRGLSHWPGGLLVLLGVMIPPLALTELMNGRRLLVETHQGWIVFRASLRYRPGKVLARQCAVRFERPLLWGLWYQVQFGSAGARGTVFISRSQWRRMTRRDVGTHGTRHN